MDAARANGSAGQFNQRLVRRTAWQLAALGAICLGLCGCRLGGAASGPPVKSFSEREQEILNVAPLGMPRDEALARLSAAGVKGTFGSRNSIYYCETWDHENGKRSHMDLALLFDEQGKLYQVRPANAVTSIESGVAGDEPIAEAPTRRTRSGRASRAADPDEPAHAKAVFTPDGGEREFDPLAGDDEFPPRRSTDSATRRGSIPDDGGFE